MADDCCGTNGSAQNENMRHGNEGSFVRWQAITIAELGFATNLILGFSVAVLGFEITLLLNGSLGISSFLPKFGFLLSLVTIAVAIGLGLWLVINRLMDFRATKSAARLREKSPLGPNSEDDKAEIAFCRAEANRRGKRTWVLFRWQIRTFAIALILFSLSIVLPAASKMFDQNTTQLSSQNSKPLPAKHLPKP